jgi:hypothetical protein
MELDLQQKQTTAAATANHGDREGDVTLDNARFNILGLTTLRGGHCPSRGNQAISLLISL